MSEYRTDKLRFMANSNDFNRETVAYLIATADRLDSDRDELVELCNEILDHASSDFDDDTSIDVIAVRYVRHLEARIDELEAALREIKALGWQNTTRIARRALGDNNE